MPRGGALGGATGNRTTVRVLNHARSRAACCRRGQLPEAAAGREGEAGGEAGGRGGPPQSLLLWHPGGLEEMAAACGQAHPGLSVVALSDDVRQREADLMRGLRADAALLGAGAGLGPWKQLTSGAHALLALLAACERVSLYGFSTYDWVGAESVPDQYGGRAAKSRSGAEWHDWGGERLAWRLLHAAGAVTICSL